MSSSPDDQMKMMLDDFNKLQAQLIELRTENYEIGNKLRKSEAENSSVQEKCTHQEKEIQKLNKLMKFPGFQAITKSKSKKDIAELIEENERLNEQMQRQEDAFKLQNRTLLEEVSRLASENDVLQEQLTSMMSTCKDTNEDQRREGDNVVEDVDELQLKTSPGCSSDNSLGSKVLDTNTCSLLDKLQKRLITELPALINKCSPQYNLNNSSIEKYDGEGPKTEINDSVDGDNSSDIKHEREETCSSETNDRVDGCGGFETQCGDNNDLSNLLESYFSELKCSLSSNVLVNCAPSYPTQESTDVQTSQECDKLRQQLSSVKESSKKEVQGLREEVAKWSEKAKKKQESFIKLQEEKEKMYEEYRKEIESLKDASAKSEENLKNIIQNKDELLKNTQNDDDLVAQLDLLRQTNEKLQGELSEWKEKQLVNTSEKVVELEGRLHNLQVEKDSLIHQIENLNSVNQDHQKTIHGLRNQIEDVKKESEKNGELAERRKCLLDKNAMEQQQNIESHQKKLEEVKERHNNEMEQLVEQKNIEIEDLRNHIVNQKKSRKESEETVKKLKKDFEESNVANMGLQEKVSALEKKCGWLERTLSEEQEGSKSLKENHGQQVKEMTDTFLKEKDEQEKIYQVQLQELEKCLKNAKLGQQESESLVEKLKQAAKDHEIELAIVKKKHDQLNKDLKRQLTAERKRADQLSVKLQDFIQEVKVKQTYDEIFNPESLQVKLASSHKRQDSGSHMSTVSSINENEDSNRSMKTSSPVGSASNISMSNNISGLSDETMDLISRYADLQQEKWILEERVRHLEETGAAMAEDVMQKSLIIQHYIMERKTDTPPAGRKSLTLKEKMMDKLKQLGAEELNREMNNKMQKILEETLATNVQLQKDLDLISAECEHLKESSKS